jgi:mRNA-degrading endonuclease YafQ of YafQ-DinJ toxin-antitoxin module
VTREVHAPKGRYSGRHKVFCTVYRDWSKLCHSRPGPMRRCYIELADNPFPGMQTNRHHQLKGKLRGFWEYEIDGGARVRYKRGPDDRVVVLVVLPRGNSSRLRREREGGNEKAPVGTREAAGDGRSGRQPLPRQDAG